LLKLVNETPDEMFQFYKESHYYHYHYQCGRLESLNWFLVEVTGLTRISLLRPGLDNPVLDQSVTSG